MILVALLSIACPISSSASSLLSPQISEVSAMGQGKQHSGRLELNVLDPPVVCHTCSSAFPMSPTSTFTPTPRLKSQFCSPLNLVASQKTLYLFAYPFPLKGPHGVAGATTGTVNLHLCHLLPVYLAPISGVSCVAKLPEVSRPSKLELAQEGCRMNI